MEKAKSKILYLVLFFIIFLGAWLRLDGIFTNSFSFTYDLGRDLIAVREIVSGTKIPLIGPTTGKEGIFYGPSWYLILTIPFFLFQGNPQGIILFIAILGILIIPAGFILGRKIGGNIVGLLFASILSFSPVMVGTSSQIWSPNLAPPFTLLLLFCLYKIFQKGILKNKLPFFVSGLALGLIMDMAIVFGTVLIFSILLFLGMYFGRRIFSRQLLFLLLGIFIILSPRVFFEFRHEFLMTKSALSSLSVSSGNQLFQSFIPNLSNRLKIMHNLFIEVLGRNIIIGNSILFLSIVCSISLFKLANKTEKYFLKLIGFLIFFYLFILTVFAHEIWEHYFVGLPIFFSLFVAISLNLLIKRKINTLVVWVIIFVLMFSLVNPGKIYSSITTPLWEGNAAVYRNQLAVVDYIYKESNGKKFNYAAYTPPIRDYTWQYLLGWYGMKKYGYKPSPEKEELFFLIIEPDYEYPGRIVNWLKVRENDGKFLREKIVKGGIKVQTRIH